MTPYLFRTDDDGQTWQRIAGPEQGFRGYVHVIREDVVTPDLLFAGTEFGLWMSIDRGAAWAQFKPGNFPAVAVRDLVVQPRDHDLVIATHGRGIWIVDDITPLRSLAGDVLSSEAAFLPTRPVQQRIQGSGGWPGGDASFSGDNPESGAVITYYQRTRHLFGQISLQVLDANGAVVDTIPASARRGINRITWSMRVKPPEVPPAAQLAQAGFNGPRVLPGPLHRAPHEGRQDLRHDAAPRARSPCHVHRDGPKGAGRGGDAHARALRVDDGAGAPRSTGCERRPTGRSSRCRRLTPPAGHWRRWLRKTDEVRKRVVATTEGGAITGEERLREHADQLYSAILSYEGRPADYQLQRIDVLTERARRRGVGVSRRAEDRASGRQRCAQEEEAGGDCGALTNQGSAAGH